MANLIRRAKKLLSKRYKKAKILGYWNDSHIDQGFVNKRARQAGFRDQVKYGQRTQESAFFIPREVAKNAIVHYVSGPMKSATRKNR